MTLQLSVLLTLLSLSHNILPSFYWLFRWLLTSLLPEHRDTPYFSVIDLALLTPSGLLLYLYRPDLKSKLFWAVNLNFPAWGHSWLYYHSFFFFFDYLGALWIKKKSEEHVAVSMSNGSFYLLAGSLSSLSLLMAAFKHNLIIYLHFLFCTVIPTVFH